MKKIAVALFIVASAVSTVSCANRRESPAKELVRRLGSVSTTTTTTHTFYDGDGKLVPAP